MWSDRCSPSRAVGPQRLHPVPAALEALPAVDAVIISHDHYDHLDVDTIKQLALTQRAKFFVPLGIGAHLRAWHIPDDRIVELDWNESAHARRARRWSARPRGTSPGRFLTRNVTLWSSWAMIGPRHRAFFGGDTGYTKSFADIGADYGPFDLTLMPIGAYHPGWPDIHMNPEDAVPRAPRRHRRRAAAADPLGDVPAGTAPVVRTRRAAARPPPRATGSGWRRPSPASASNRRIGDIGPMVAGLTG